MKFINVSSSGDLFIPGLGEVLAGKSVDVDGALAEQFAGQPDNWKKVEK